MKSIEIKNMSFSYGKHLILDNINFYAKENETIGIIGENGAGKSTLLKILIGLLTDYTGEVLINDLPVIEKNLAEIRKRIGYVFQDSESQLFMSKVYDDVAFAPRNYGVSEEEVHRRVMEALGKVHAEYLKDRHTYKMSGGQKKLVSIATILSMEPDIILLDEPTVALDPRNRRNIINVLNEMSGLKIIASHDLDMILETCDRTILLSKGKIIRDGTTKEILTDKILLEENGLELPLTLWR